MALAKESVPADKKPHNSGNPYLRLLAAGFLLIIFIIQGCGGGAEKISPDKLKELVSRAAQGRAGADDSLSGLFASAEVFGKPDAIDLETMTLSGVNYFGVAVSFPSSVNNRFALYDDELNCYVIDKSVNGRLTLSVSQSSDLNYFDLNERFFSNDSIELERYSIYRGDSSGFTLAFRTFTMMRTRDTVFQHNLYEISSEMIRANITAPIFSGLNNLNDDYFYDKKLKVYYVKKSIFFDDFVTAFINSIKDTVNEFITPISMKNDELEEAFEITDGYVPEYYLSLNEEWRELRNISGSHLLKKELTGSKFVNDRLGSDIYVFPIPFNRMAEEFISVQLDNSVNGNYQVRYSEGYKISGHIQKYFEYSCRTKKFVLILSAAAGTYPDHLNEYNEIINTFYINC